MADRCFNKDYDNHPLRDPSHKLKGKLKNGITFF